MKRLIISLLLLVALAGITLVSLYSSTFAEPTDDTDPTSQYQARRGQATPDPRQRRIVDRSEDKNELWRVIRPSGEE